MIALHGVWRTPGEFVPLFADLRLVAYLASLARQAARSGELPPVVLPVFSREPAHFRREGRVFLSTALILSANTEETLLQAIRSDISTASHGTFRDAPCSAVTGALATLAEVQAALAVQIGEYDKWFQRGLKRR
jgi:hypothetical protein